MGKKTYGYVRVSSRDQNIDRQIAAMEKIPIRKEDIYIDRQSGKDFDRPSYRRLLNRLRPGDTLFVKSIDRLGRNYDEIIEQWRTLTKAKDVDIVVIDFPLLQIMSYVAQIERENIRQRQAEGIAVAKLKGVAFGRPRKEIPEEFPDVVKLWENNQISMREAARRLGTSHSMFAKWISQCQDKNKC